MIWRGVLWVLLFGAACGGASSAKPAPTREGPPPPADVAAARAQLERYSPSGHAIVSGYESLPREWTIAGRTYSAITSVTFDEFIEDGSPANAVSYLRAAVHEVYHGYSGVMSYKLLAETKVRNLHGLAVVQVHGEPILIVQAKSFPAREVVSTFPTDAHTMRFEAYVSKSPDQQSTQASGIYGLLDEYAAYYHGARTLVDMWPWVDGAAPASYEVIMRYTGDLLGAPVPHAEFKLFILHYLWFAREHRPQVYQAVIEDPSFRRAFTEIDDAYTRLVEEIRVLEPTVHRLARKRGVNVEALRTVVDQHYPAVLRHLSSARYQRVLAELRQP